MKITLLVDNPESWIMPYAARLFELLENSGHVVHLVHEAEAVAPGDIAFLLGCERLVKQPILERNTHTVVIHESALPAGKGWSPLTWQILEGKNEIPITLFEAVDSVDSGQIYLQDTLRFEGHELNAELKDAQGKKTIELVQRFVDSYATIKGKDQAGLESFYPRRTPRDSELDPHKTIADQFNLLRVVDNERYPAFFTYQGKTYVVKILKKE